MDYLEIVVSIDAGNQYSESDYSVSYEKGVFTITTTGPYFARDVTYRLVYEYE